MKKIIFSICILLTFQASQAQFGTIKSISTIAAGQGGLSASIDFKSLGIRIVQIGDLDNDGNMDLVSTAGTSSSEPLLLVMFMNNNGTVKSTVEIGQNKGGFTGNISFSDDFGSGLASLGDLDVDGVPDIAVGSSQRSPASQGAIWILFMKSDGTVKSNIEIKSGTGGFTGVLYDDDFFGKDLACIGDLNKDGVPDLAVGSIGNDEGGDMYGAAWILFMKNDGTVNSFKKISNSTPLLTGKLKGWFGSSVAYMGDYNHDGKADMAVGSQDDLGAGAVFILSLNTDASLFSVKKLIPMIHY